MGRIVAHAAAKNLTLESLPDSDLALFFDRFPPGYSSTLSPVGSVRRRSHTGGPAPETVLRRLGEIWQEIFSAAPPWASPSSSSSEARGGR